MAQADNKPWTILNFYTAYKDEKDIQVGRASAELTVWKKKIDRHYCFPAHTAFCFVYEGDFLLTFNGKTYAVGEGDLCVMRAGTEWVSSFHGNAPTTVFSVNFGGPLSEEIIRSYLNQNDVFFAQSGCRGLSDRLLGACERKDLGSRELYDEFMVFLLRACQRLSANRVGEDEGTLPRKIRYFILRFATNGKLSVKSIANAFSIRVQDLQELWKETFGVTVHRYIQDVRLERAAELLLMSNIGISQIAEETGHTDRCYFDKLFLRKYGMTPSAYRKSHGRTE